jgi:hypothetical protein
MPGWLSYRLIDNSTNRAFLCQQEQLMDLAYINSAMIAFNASGLGCVIS